MSSEQEDALVAAYLQGTSATELVERYQISESTVYTTLERHGVPRRTGSEILRKLCPAQEAEIIVLYQQGLSASDIVTRYPIHDQTVYNILERHGIKRRTRSEAVRTYARNEHAFDIIDTEEAAYWLGFIAGWQCFQRAIAHWIIHERCQPFAEVCYLDLAGPADLYGHK